MKPDEFRDNILGRWSSHPHWGSWRRRWCVRLVFVPLVMIVVAGVYSALNPANWLNLLNQAPFWLTGMGAALAGALSAIITLGICSRIGEWRAGRDLKQFGEASMLRIDPWILVTGLLLGAVGPFLLSQMAGISPTIRLLFLCFAIFPLLCLLYTSPSPRD